MNKLSKIIWYYWKYSFSSSFKVRVYSSGFIWVLLGRLGIILNFFHHKITGYCIFSDKKGNQENQHYENQKCHTNIHYFHVLCLYDFLSDILTSLSICPLQRYNDYESYQSHKHDQRNQEERYEVTDLFFHFCFECIQTYTMPFTHLILELCLAHFAANFCFVFRVVLARNPLYETFFMSVGHTSWTKTWLDYSPLIFTLQADPALFSILIDHRICLFNWHTKRITTILII